MSDRIFLEALDIQGVIGIYDWERTTKQTIRVDLEMPANASFASGSDDISDTLNYKDVAKRIIAYVENTEYQLIETLVENIASIILDEFKVGWVEVSLPVANNRWLARLLIRLGPDAVVVSPGDAAVEATALASAILAQY